MEENMRVYKVTKKKKTLLRLSTKQGLKLCGFNLGKRQTFLPWKKQFGFAGTIIIIPTRLNWRYSE